MKEAPLLGTGLKKYFGFGVSLQKYQKYLYIRQFTDPHKQPIP